MQSRRNLIKSITAAAILPWNAATPQFSSSNFRFCLNTSTISGQKPGLEKYIEIASAAGYDGVELWISDIRQWMDEGKSLDALASLLRTKRLKVENAISFTEWLVDDDGRREQALQKLEAEMKIMAALDCHRIAAPPAGIPKGALPDTQKAGERYRNIITLGKKYGVMPLLEFWGASGSLYQFGQALAIAAAANDKEVRILPDVYHLHRGGSEFNSLEMVNGHVIDVIHMNDYPGNKPLAELTDADRVYPGDGVAPFPAILHSLKNIGGTKVLSLELFNRNYWAQDPLMVAKTGLQKMKALVDGIKD